MAWGKISCLDCGKKFSGSSFAVGLCDECIKKYNDEAADNVLKKKNGSKETMKDQPWDLYSVLQGKKNLIKEMDLLLAKGFTLEETYTLTKNMYENM